MHPLLDPVDHFETCRQPFFCQCIVSDGRIQNLVACFHQNYGDCPQALLSWYFYTLTRIKCKKEDDFMIEACKLDCSSFCAWVKPYTVWEPVGRLKIKTLWSKVQRTSPPSARVAAIRFMLQQHCKTKMKTTSKMKMTSKMKTNSKMKVSLMTSHLDSHMTTDVKPDMWCPNWKWNST